MAEVYRICLVPGNKIYEFVILTESVNGEEGGTGDRENSRKIKKLKKIFDKEVMIHYLQQHSITNHKNGRLAQLGERYPYKVDVGGSNPSTPTIFIPR